jgi:hypothetical protein
MRLDRGDAERDLDPLPSFRSRIGFIVLDAFAPADPAQRCLDFRQPVIGTSNVTFSPTASAAVCPNSRSAAEFQPVIVPSSDIVMMRRWTIRLAALNSRSRSA